MRARSCWCSGIACWIGATLRDQICRKEINAGGQFSCDRSCCSADLDVRGKGTEGGIVVDRRAEKYKHNAGPVTTVVNRSVCSKENQYAPAIIMSASALLNNSVSNSLSAFACANDDLR